MIPDPAELPGYNNSLDDGFGLSDYGASGAVLFAARLTEGREDDEFFLPPTREADRVDIVSSMCMEHAHGNDMSDVCTPGRGADNSIVFYTTPPWTGGEDQRLLVGRDAHDATLFLLPSPPLEWRFFSWDEWRVMSMLLDSPVDDFEVYYGYGSSTPTWMSIPAPPYWVMTGDGDPQEAFEDTTASMLPLYTYGKPAVQWRYDCTWHPESDLGEGGMFIQYQLWDTPAVVPAELGYLTDALPEHYAYAPVYHFSECNETMSRHDGGSVSYNFAGEALAETNGIDEEGEPIALQLYRSEQLPENAVNFFENFYDSKRSRTKLTADIEVEMILPDYETAPSLTLIERADPWRETGVGYVSVEHIGFLLLVPVEDEDDD